MPGWKPWETYVNERLGLDATVASGSQFYDKGDGVDRGRGEWAYQVEAKYTDKISFAVKGKELGQWVTRARMAGKRFALVVRVWGRGYAQPSDYVVLPFEDFVELLAALREAEHA